MCTAGTADISVAEEAAQTAEFFGTYVDRIYDVGVSGMHRLFSRKNGYDTEGELCSSCGRDGRGTCKCDEAVWSADL